MSLEEAILQNTAAIREMIAALQVQIAAEPVKKVVVSEVPVVADTTPQPTVVPYEDVKKIIIETAKRPGGKEAIISLLAEFGAKSGLELKEDQYADFVKLATKLEI